MESITLDCVQYEYEWLGETKEVELKPGLFLSF